MALHHLNPLTDPRWTEFLASHPQASIFHTPQWLKALNKTYGYRPVVFSTSDAAELTNGFVFCEIESWLTGRRLVSLPFSDHCQPLAEGDSLTEILRGLQSSRASQRWKYIELRPICGNCAEASGGAFGKQQVFGLHTIDLRDDITAVYRRFHDSCIRRKIKRADNEGLEYQVGRSELLLRQFRHLSLLTRRRHKLPPPPVSWFENLVRYVGDDLTIHVLAKNCEPIASIMTLKFKKSLVYKYGCSDARYHNMGGMPLLFWKAIQMAHELGVEQLDLGRSGYDDPGLIAFKEHLGGVGSELTYYQNPARDMKTLDASKMAWSRNVLPLLPDPLLAGAGRFLYRHIG